MKMCASTMESRRRDNNVHFVSKHVYKNGFLGTHMFIGFLGQIRVCKIVWGSSFLWDWINYISTRVCTKLQTLQQKVQRDE